MKEQSRLNWIIAQWCLSVRHNPKVYYQVINLDNIHPAWYKSNSVERFTDHVNLISAQNGKINHRNFVSIFRYFPFSFPFFRNFSSHLRCWIFPGVNKNNAIFRYKTAGVNVYDDLSSTNNLVFLVAKPASDKFRL